MGSEPTEIIPRLWLGDMDTAKDAKFFKKNNIKAVLNCTKDVPNYFASKGIEYMRIPVDDDLSKIEIKHMKNYIPHVISFIYKNRDIEEKNVFIHCYAGVQRSAICVVAYLIKAEGFTKKKAIKYVVNKRSVAFFGGRSINFKDALNDI